MLKLRFSAGGGASGAIVRWATWSWCAHVGLVLPSGKVIDATPEHGVCIRRATDNETTKYFAIADAPLCFQRRALLLAMSQIGKPYDWRGISAFALHRDWKAESAWFCSELVAWACAEASLPLLRTDHVNRITPRDLLLSPRLIPAAKE